MPKDLPELIQKSKWSKPAKEVETWDQWWAMHQKILKPLQKTAKIINSWWSFTGIFGTTSVFHAMVLQNDEITETPFFG